jgi:hypothetical protein
VWTPHRLVFDAPEKSGSESVCGLHTALSLMLQEGVETRQHVDSTLPCLQYLGNGMGKPMGIAPAVEILLVNCKHICS